MTDIKDFLKHIIEQIVDYPDEIRLLESEGLHVIIYDLNVNKSDMGKIIGKKGKNAEAIRILLNAFSAKHGKRTVLEISDKD